MSRRVGIRLSVGRGLGFGSREPAGLALDELTFIKRIFVQRWVELFRGIPGSLEDAVSGSARNPRSCRDRSSSHRDSESGGEAQGESIGRGFEPLPPHKSLIMSAFCSPDRSGGIRFRGSVRSGTIQFARPWRARVQRVDLERTGRVPSTCVRRIRRADRSSQPDNNRPRTGVPGWRRRGCRRWDRD